MPAGGKTTLLELPPDDQPAQASDGGPTAKRAAGERFLMLSDKDRIFTNLYGEQPWNLAAARKRGDWEGTQRGHPQGPRLDRRGDEAVAASAAAAAPASRPG